MDKKDYDRLIELETKAKQRFDNSDWDTVISTLVELETKAKQRFDNSDWDTVISMLDCDEQKEYYELKEKNNAI